MHLSGSLDSTALFSLFTSLFMLIDVAISCDNEFCCFVKKNNNSWFVLNLLPINLTVVWDINLSLCAFSTLLMWPTFISNIPLFGRPPPLPFYLHFSCFAVSFKSLFQPTGAYLLPLSDDRNQNWLRWRGGGHVVLVPCLQLGYFQHYKLVGNSRVADFTCCLSLLWFVFLCQKQQST